MVRLNRNEKDLTYDLRLDLSAILFLTKEFPW